MENRSKEASYSDDSPEFMKHYFSEICSEQLRIPPAFIEKLNGNVPQTSKLEGPGGRSWPVVVTKVNGDFFFQDGWPEFVHDNSLEELDFLTFAYSGSNFYVKIFGKSGSRKKAIPTCRENSTQEQLHGDQTVMSGKSDHIRVIPQFEVTLSHTYVTECLNVTKQFSQSYVKTYLDSVTDCKDGRKVILQIQDKSWDVILVKCGRRYQLRRGWLTFVKENSLEEGDQCKFELIKRNPFVLKVTITKLF